VPDVAMYSYSSEGFSAIEQIVGVCGQQEVGVESEDDNSGPKGESESEVAVFGCDLVSDPIGNPSQQEVYAQQWDQP